MRTALMEVENIATRRVVGTSALRVIVGVWKVWGCGSKMCFFYNQYGKKEKRTRNDKGWFSNGFHFELPPLGFWGASRHWFLCRVLWLFHRCLSSVSSRKKAFASGESHCSKSPQRPGLGHQRCLKASSYLSSIPWPLLDVWSS